MRYHNHASGGVYCRHLSLIGCLLHTRYIRSVLYVVVILLIVLLLCRSIGLTDYTNYYTAAMPSTDGAPFLLSSAVAAETECPIVVVHTKSCEVMYWQSSVPRRYRRSRSEHFCCVCCTYSGET